MSYGVNAPARCRGYGVAALLGRQGRMAGSILTTLGAAGAKLQGRVMVEIIKWEPIVFRKPLRSSSRKTLNLHEGK